MWETWVRSLGQEDPLEKEMALHSSTLPWKILRTEDPGRLQSMGLQRVGHNWATSLSTHYLGLPGGSVVKNLLARAGEQETQVWSLPGSVKSPGEGNGNPSQYSCLENPMDRGAWWATVHGSVKESDMTSTKQWTHRLLRGKKKATLF